MGSGSKSSLFLFQSHPVRVLWEVRRADHRHISPIDEVHHIAGNERSGGKACSRGAQAWVRLHGISRLPKVRLERTRLAKCT